MPSTINGEMPEWSIGPAWKAGVGETLPGVRIPLSPPAFALNAVCEGCRDEARRNSTLITEYGASFGSARPVLELSSEVGNGF